MAEAGFFIFFIAIILWAKGIDCRLVFLSLGLLLGILSGKLSPAFDAVSLAIVEKQSIIGVCAVLGYSYLMKKYQYQQELIGLCRNVVQRNRAIVLPGILLITLVTNMFITSALECAAIIGCLIIPLLEQTGFPPGLTGSAIVCGTWGSVLNSESLHNIYISKLLGIQAQQVVFGHLPATGIALIVLLLVFSILSNRSEKLAVYSEVVLNHQANDKLVIDSKKKWCSAVFPLLPLLIMLKGNCLATIISDITLLKAVFISLFIVLLTGNRQEKIANFFHGIGQGITGVMSVILCAVFFVQVMEVSGMTTRLLKFYSTELFNTNGLATYGPLITSFFTGSGDISSMAFHTAVTAKAGQLGTSALALGSHAYLTASWGRCFSPLAGSLILCAQLSGGHIFHILSINAVVMVAIAVLNMIIL